MDAHQRAINVVLLGRWQNVKEIISLLSVASPVLKWVLAVVVAGGIFKFVNLSLQVWVASIEDSGCVKYSRANNLLQPTLCRGIFLRAASLFSRKKLPRQKAAEHGVRHIN